LAICSERDHETDRTGTADPAVFSPVFIFGSELTEHNNRAGGDAAQQKSFRCFEAPEDTVVLRGVGRRVIRETEVSLVPIGGSFCQLSFSNTEGPAVSRRTVSSIHHSAP